MDKCYVCKSNRRQLLMLACSHDVCIKCAADNYFLNSVGRGRNDNKKSKKESYFCQICLEVTKIDQSTVNELKQWYINNVNSKSSSKGNRNDARDKRKEVGKLGEEKVGMRSKVPTKSQYANHLVEEQQYRQRQYAPLGVDNKRGGRPVVDDQQRYFNQRRQSEYNQRNYTQGYQNQQRGKNKIDYRKQMPEEYQARELLRFREDKALQRVYGRNEGLQRLKEKQENNYQRFSYTPNELVQHRRQPSEQKSTGSKQKRVFGSIVKRDSIKNDDYYRETVLRGRQEEKRRRIDSWKSEEKYATEWNGKRMQTEGDGRSSQREGRIGQRRGVQQKQVVTPRQSARQTKKKQVYMDLIGYEHSLQSETGSCFEGPILNGSQFDQSPQKRQIINKFATTTQSTYYNTQNTATTPTKLPRNHANNAGGNNVPHNGVRRLYCNIHQDEEVIYYCLECRVLICSECALYGEHKEHNIHTLKKAAYKLKETLYVLISEMNSFLLVEEQKEQLLLEQIKQIKVESNKERQKVKFAFENFIKNVQNKYAQVLEQLEESQSKALLGFNSQLDKTKQKCSEFFQRKTSMKNLFDTFTKNPTNNQLSAPFQYDSIKNPPGSTNASNNNQERFNRGYRQFDDFFEENSMTSEQRNFFNTNIQELQSKICDFEEYIKKLKPEYQKIIYPTFYNNNNQGSSSSKKTTSVTKSKQFLRSGSKSRRQSQQLHESLKLSETSLLIQPNGGSTQKMHKYEQFFGDEDFIQENNLKSLNFVIEKQLASGQFSELRENLRVGHVDTVVESIKEIEEIIKEFRVEYRVYEMKAGRRE